MKNKLLNKLFVVLAALILLSLGNNAYAQEPEPTEEAVTQLTVEATAEPTEEATTEPTTEATIEATVEPTEEVTVEPTVEATVEPTEEATTEPTIEATVEPTEEATTEPTIEATAEPTEEATAEATTIESSAGIVGEGIPNKSMSTQLALQNLSSSTTANIGITFYKEDAQGGGVVGSTTNASIDPLRMLYYDQFNNQPFNLGDGFSGSAVVETGSTALAGIVLQGSRTSSVVSYGAYRNITPASEILLPILFRESPSSNGNWNTEIAIQNTGTSAVDVNVIFRNGTNAAIVTTESINIEPSSTAYLRQDQMGEAKLPNLDTSGCCNFWYGSARIQAQGGGQVTAVVNQWADNELLTYDGVPVPDTGLADLPKTVYAPYIARLLPAPSDWSTPYAALNASDSTANVTITYIKNPASPGSTPSPYTTSVPPWGLFSENLRSGSVPSGLGSFWYGSAIISSDQPIALIVNEMKRTGDSAMAYNGAYATNATNTVYGPWVMRQFNGDFSSTWQVVNVSGNTAHLFAEYLNKDGSVALRQPLAGTMDIASGQSWFENNRSPNSAINRLSAETNWQGSVVVYSDEPILGIINFLNDGLSGDGYASYNFENN